MKSSNDRVKLWKIGQWDQLRVAALIGDGQLPLRPPGDAIPSAIPKDRHTAAQSRDLACQRLPSKSSMKAMIVAFAHLDRCNPLRRTVTEEPTEAEPDLFVIDALPQVHHGGVSAVLAWGRFVGLKPDIRIAAKTSERILVSDFLLMPRATGSISRRPAAASPSQEEAPQAARRPYRRGASRRTGDRGGGLASGRLWPQWPRARRRG